MTTRRRLILLACSTLACFVGIAAVTGARAGAPLQHPSGLVIDKSGVLWVANSDRNEVQSYNISTLPPTLGIAIKHDLADPTRLAVFQGDLYVANTAGNSVTVYNAKTGVERKARKIVGLDKPEGIAVDASGNVLVANGGNDTVQGFSPAGALIGTETGDSGGAFGLLSTLHIERGTLYLGIGPKVGADSVREYAAATFFAGTPTPSAVLTTGISGPTGVVLSRGHRFVLVCNLYANDVSRYVAGTGAPATGISRHISKPEGIAVDGLGRIFVSDAAANNVSVFTAKGVFITTF